MGESTPTPMNELEEAAQGHELFRAPGAELEREQAYDQAIASGWLPADVVYEPATVETHRQIAGRRQDLYDAMQRLESSVARASGLNDWAEKVDEALERLRSSLERHVAEVEAPDGLFADIMDRAPRLAHDVERLRKEHRELTSACRSARDLISADADVQEIRRKVLGMLGRLAIHRQRGSELLFDTYNVDLAAAD